MLIIFGLFLNLVGTILIAISFGPYPAEDGPYTSTSDETGKEIMKSYVAHFNHPKFFRAGLFLVVMGFLLQFFGALQASSGQILNPEVIER